MFPTLLQHAERAPDRPALREWTGTGWRTVRRGELADGVAAVEAWAGGLGDATASVVVAVDGGAASATVMLGLLGARVPVLPVEYPGSLLSDPASPVFRVRPAALVLPPGTAAPAHADVPVYGYPDLLAGGRPAGGRPGPGTLLQVTSGSTGEPRIARLSVDDLLRGAAIYRDLFQYTEHDTVLLPMSFAHSFGMTGGLAAAITSGAELVLVPRLGLGAVHDALAGGVTVLLGMPLLYQLLAASGASGPALRVALSSGGPLTEVVRDSAERTLGLAIRQVYGSTETGLIAAQRERRQPWPVDSVGIAGPGVQWRVRSDGPAAGRLLVRTSTMFSGYWPDSDPVGADGFYDTGDVARVDENGVLYLIGRKSTFVNVGGRKVNRSVVERVVGGHPAVRDVHVFDLPHGGEQAVHAAVVLDAPWDQRLAELSAFLRDRLQPYEFPRLHVLAHLPRTSMGKVRLSALLQAIGRS